MPIIAKIDDNNILRGFAKVPKSKCVDGPGRVALEDLDSCDLTPGKYKWDAAARAFMPLGAGHGKPAPCRVPDDYAIYLALRSIRDGSAFPAPCLEWIDWYEATIAPRNDERIQAEG